jgi:predicted Rossmann fold flavoprotein
MKPIYDLIVVGGGAAGVFAAIIAKERNAATRVAILEKTATLLAKVRVSGGGRCNVTHNQLDPKELVKNYPRGNKELLGPFHTFGPKETIKWFEDHGVPLKAEADGRMFPVTNSSQTIIDCLLFEAKKLGVEIHLQTKIESIQKGFEILLKNGEKLQTKSLLLATGSSKEGHEFAKSFGHTIIPPIPSLFTFNVPNFALEPLSGVALPNARIQIVSRKRAEEGPLLITHFGFSGPAALKLSAWEAPYLFEKNYEVALQICWNSDYDFKKLFELLKKGPISSLPYPKRLLKALAPNIADKQLSRIELEKIAKKLTEDVYLVKGKTTNKEEFVTCGGVDLKEVNFKRMESKICPDLFFAGEILNIDAVTGGFNFQASWTGGFICSTHFGCQ